MKEAINESERVLVKTFWLEMFNRKIRRGVDEEGNQRKKKGDKKQEKTKNERMETKTKT